MLLVIYINRSRIYRYILYYVYIGAIAVLFLFVIMMINIEVSDVIETGSQYTKTLPLALSVDFYLYMKYIILYLSVLIYMAPLQFRSFFYFN